MSTTDARQDAYWNREQGFRRFDHPVVRLFAQQRLKLLSTWIDGAVVTRALDVGCGDGFSTYYTRQWIPEVWAVDRSTHMLSRHPLRPEGRVVAADARTLPYRPETFDLVYGWEMLHHISDPGAVVTEMARVSRRYVLIVEPNRNHPLQFAFALADREHRWVLRYSRTYLESLCTGAGLRIVQSTTGGFIFPNRTPSALAPLLANLPYRSPFGISNWVLGEKQ
jgi:SAM-dependent methyltransferase